MVDMLESDYPFVTGAAEFIQGVEEAPGDPPDDDGPATESDAPFVTGAAEFSLIFVEDPEED
jgi:hypothetical protein